MGEEKKPEEEKKAEEEKKPEEQKPKAAAAEEKPKAEDEPKKEGGAEEKKEGGGEEKKKEGEAPAAQAPPPPPPEEVEMRVFMHCEGCARKVKRSLKGFDGVEEVRTDCRSHKVVVKGKKAAEDPLKLVERVQKKTGRRVELLTPLPPPKSEEKEEDKKEEDKPKPEDKKEEPVVIAVVLKVHMHCEACAQEIKKRILRMKGVQSAESELKASQVKVKGVFDPPKLVEYVHKRTGKHAVVVKTEPVEKKVEDDKAKDDNKSKDEKIDGDKAEGEKKEKEGEGKGKEGKKELSEEETAAAVAAAAAAGAKMEQKRNEFFYYYPSIPRYPMEYSAYNVYPQLHHQQVAYAPQPPQMAYPPQMFSDENPNACSVM